MEILTQRYKRRPNEKIESLYFGVAPGGRTVTSIVKPSEDGNHMEATRVYGPGLPRGEGGQIATLILGGMEVTLAEIEDILAAKREKKFVPRRSPGEIVDMCRQLQERRNEQIIHLRKNPSEAPKRARIPFYLPVGVKMVPTSVPGLRIAARS